MTSGALTVNSLQSAKIQIQNNYFSNATNSIDATSESSSLINITSNEFVGSGGIIATSLSSSTIYVIGNVLSDFAADFAISFSGTCDVRNNTIAQHTAGTCSLCGSALKGNVVDNVVIDSQVRYAYDLSGTSIVVEGNLVDNVHLVTSACNYFFYSPFPSIFLVFSPFSSISLNFPPV
jgi:hypothetical protein